MSRRFIACIAAMVALLAGCAQNETGVALSEFRHSQTSTFFAQLPDEQVILAMQEVCIELKAGNPLSKIGREQTTAMESRFPISATGAEFTEMSNEAEDLGRIDREAVIHLCPTYRPSLGS